MLFQYLLAEFIHLAEYDGSDIQPVTSKAESANPAEQVYVDNISHLRFL
jgi:hypothetical protein